MVADSDESLDWSKVSPEMACQILEQGATFLQAQLQVALAADQRAATMASLLTSIAVAVIAAALAYWDKTGSVGALFGGLGGAAVLLIGAGFGVWAARPVDFYFAGNQPAQWFAIRHGNLVEAMGGEAENYEAHIAKNDDLLGKNQRALTTGARVAMAAPVVMAAAWWLATCFSSPA